MAKDEILNERHEECPFAGRAAEDVVTRAKFGNAAMAAWATLAVIVLIAIITNSISMGRMANTVTHTSIEVREIKDGQKQIVKILENQAAMKNELNNMNRRMSDLEMRLSEGQH